MILFIGCHPETIVSGPFFDELLKYHYSFDNFLITVTVNRIYVLNAIIQRRWNIPGFFYDCFSEGDLIEYSS